MPTESADFAAEAITRNLYLEMSAELDETVALAAVELLAHVRKFHRSIDEAYFRSGVVLVREFPNPGPPSNSADVFTSLAELHRLMETPRNGVRIRILQDNRYEVTYLAVDIGPEVDVVKYFIRPGGQECVVAPSMTFHIPSVIGQVSPFAVTYFRDLRRALDEYRSMRATRSDCEFLKQAWHGSGRIALSNKPEKHMRRSLHDFLKIRLRDASPIVLQEQIVDETKPVDIRIQWIDRRRVSLLEVKWLGQSVNARSNGVGRMWGDPRAREGYVQTANYLNLQRATSPDDVVNATLVVFDARRDGVSWISPGSAKSTGPWSYETAAIDYSSVAISDISMELPVRFYLEPDEMRVA